MPACAASSNKGCSRWCVRSASGPPSSPGRAISNGWRVRAAWNWRDAGGVSCVIASLHSFICHYDDVTRPTSNLFTPDPERILGENMIKNFLQELRTQRWDDHRYYHHSRINQSLHFVSAASFLIAYVMVFIDPVVSALLGWLVSMTSRQAGHFFFEPRGYDHVNHASHEHKEEIKVGYNLQRKVVLMTIWGLSPVILFFDPTLFGLFEPWASPADFMRQVAKIWLV